MAAILRTGSANSNMDVAQLPLARLAGPLALAAGSLFTLTQLVMLTRMSPLDRTDLHWREILLADQIYLISGVVYFAVFCLIVLALVALYGREAHKAGTLWAIGVCAAIVGTMNLGGNFWFEGFVSPWIATVGPDVLSARPSGYILIGAYFSYSLFTLGWVTFGLASLRARVFPVAICLAIVVGGIIGFIASPPFGIPIGIAIAAMGAWLLRTKTSARTIAAPATLSN